MARNTSNEKNASFLAKQRIARQWGFSSFEVFSQYCNINHEDVGPLLSNLGLERVVFKYNDDKVIKIPRKGILNKLNCLRDNSNDVVLLRKYFGDYIVSGQEFIRTKNRFLTIEVQCKIKDAENFTHGKAVNHLYTQLQEIYSRSRILKKNEGVSIDLIGGDGIWRYGWQKIKSLITRESVERRLTNVVVSQERLHIIDLRLLNTRISRIRGGLWLLHTVYGNMEALVTFFYVKFFFLKKVKKKRKFSFLEKLWPGTW